MLKDLNAGAITTLHDQRLLEPGWPAVRRVLFEQGVWHWIDSNHLYNALLWDEEDRARRTDVPANEIACCKRNIDAYNQKRNDAVEVIDQCILAALRHVTPLPLARLHSETAGMMIDRLSILSLKIFHMRLQTERTDVDREHTLRCTHKLGRLLEQRSDLRNCLSALLADAAAGRAYFKIHRQFKMYNDASLNPYLYSTQR